MTEPAPQHAAWKNAWQAAVALLLGGACVVLVQELKEIPRLILSVFPLVVWVVPQRMRPVTQALVLAVLLTLMGMMLGFAALHALIHQDTEHPVMPVGEVIFGMPLGALAGLVLAWRHAHSATRSLYAERIFLTLCALNMGITCLWRAD